MQAQTVAEFHRGDAALLFQTIPRTLDDGQELAVGAERGRFSVSIPDGDHCGNWLSGLGPALIFFTHAHAF